MRSQNYFGHLQRNVFHSHVQFQSNVVFISTSITFLVYSNNVLDLSNPGKFFPVRPLFRDSGDVFSVFVTIGAPASPRRSAPSFSRTRFQTWRTPGAELLSKTWRCFLNARSRVSRFFTRPSPGRACASNHGCNFTAAVFKTGVRGRQGVRDLSWKLSLGCSFRMFF